MRIVTVILMAIMLAGGTGCENVKQWMGYPTDAEITAALQKEADAQAAIDAATSEITSLEQQIESLTATKHDADSRQEQTRALYAQLAQQLPTLEGPAAEAMMASMASLQTQLHSSAETSSSAAQQIASVEASISRLRADEQAARTTLNAVTLKLDGFVERADSSVTNATALIRDVGGTVQALGVPAAEPIGNNIAEIVGLVGSLLLSGGLIDQLRRRRRDRTAAAALMAGMEEQHDRDLASMTSERDRAAHSFGLLAKVAKVNEKLGLIISSTGNDNRSPEQIKEVKAEARGMIGAEALGLLRTVTADVEATGKLEMGGAAT